MWRRHRREAVSERRYLDESAVTTFAATVEAETREPVVVTERVVLGTDDWVKGLVYDDGWLVVESVGIADPDEERFEAMQDCEAAITDYESD